MSVKPYGVVVMDVLNREIIIPFPGDPRITISCGERLVTPYVDTWEEFQGPDGTDWAVHIHQEDTSEYTEFCVYPSYDWGTDVSIPYPLELICIPPCNRDPGCVIYC